MIYYKRFKVYHIGKMYTVFDPRNWSMVDFKTWKEAKHYMKGR